MSMNPCVAFNGLVRDQDRANMHSSHRDVTKGREINN